MARQKGTFSLSANLEPRAAAPLDARSKVALKSDLTTEGTFPYPYEGMEVYVVEEKKKYILTGEDPTVVGNWKEAGNDAVGGIIDVETLPTSNIKNTFYRISNEIYLDYTSSVNKTYAEITTDTLKITNVLDKAGINYNVETSEQFIVNEIIINDSNKLFLDIEKLVSDMYPSQPDKYSQYIGHYIQKIAIESDRLEINFDNSPSPSSYVIFSEKYNFKLFVASMPDEQIFMGDEKNNKVKELYNINIFTGTQAEWDALSTAVKKTYGQVNITDDGVGTYGYNVDTTSNSFPVYWRKIEGVLECWGVIPANTASVVFPFEYDALPAIFLESYNPYAGTSHAIVDSPTTTGFNPQDGQYSMTAQAVRVNTAFRAIGIKEG